MTNAVAFYCTAEKTNWFVTEIHGEPIQVHGTEHETNNQKAADYFNNLSDV